MAIIIQQITLITAKIRRKRFNQLIDSSCFWRFVGEEEKLRIFNEGRTHRPFKISIVLKFSNKDPGGLGGGRIVNKGGGGSRRKSTFFI
jgi:hypothetical protein